MMRPALMVSSVCAGKRMWRSVAGLADRTAVHSTVAEMFGTFSIRRMRSVATFMCKSPASYKISPGLRRQRSDVEERGPAHAIVFAI